MITEEQLKKILDSLRLKKYDTPEYKIEVFCEKDRFYICIHNTETNNCLDIHLYHSKIKRLFWKNLYIKTIKPHAVVEKYTIDQSSSIDNIIISEKLYKSFSAYIIEREEQDKFISEFNVNSEFNL